MKPSLGVFAIYSDARAAERLSFDPRSRDEVEGRRVADDGALHGPSANTFSAASWRSSAVSFNNRHRVPGRNRRSALSAAQGVAEQAPAGFVLWQSESGADRGSGLCFGLGPVRGRTAGSRDDALQPADRPQRGQRRVVTQLVELPLDLVQERGELLGNRWQAPHQLILKRSVKDLLARTARARSGSGPPSELQ
ncbi:protein of unknown function [Streptomyces sp. KY75]|nr:protein of unknown function [Streptomyces sp. KY75]CAD5994575.1 protein of unknown function [Streptomyces sp. KY70]